MQKPFYITTTLPYVNADPHIGFALEIVHADIQARNQRLQGREVFFTTGTDEHGQKIAQKAEEQGTDVQQYVDHYAGQFEKLKLALNLSYDSFIRTTDAKHVAAAQELWKRCERAGDIEKRKYKGLYCVGDEMFLKETDIVNGKCPNHPNMDPIEIEEENYFFLLSKYQQRLTEYLSREDVILPSWRRDEALKFVEQGLEDFSISREKARMSWGIPVPADDAQVMYVWFDALTNYISTLGWPCFAKATQGKPDLFERFWTHGETVQLAGKDQVRFQSIMWQAMLMSANLKPSDKVVYHGFITSGGQKMSKSLGNVIEPFAIVDEYGTDALRYYLARHISPFEDSDFTMERFKELYNADLVNGVGNAVARVMQLASTHGANSSYAEADIEKPLEDESFSNAMKGYDLQLYMSLVQAHVTSIDAEITATQPFKVIKEDKERGMKMLSLLADKIFVLGLMLKPIIPGTAQIILESVVANKKPTNLFPRKE